MGLTSRLLLGIIAAVTLISATTISKETDGLMVPVRQVQDGLWDKNDHATDDRAGMLVEFVSRTRPSQDEPELC